MKRIFFAALAVSALAAAVPAQAQTGCSIDSINQATSCLTKALAQAETDMQTKLADAEASVKTRSTYAAELAKSQETWLAYRAATCDALVKTFWGEGQLRDLAPVSCRLALTKARATDLDNAFHGLWGLQQ